MRGESTDDARLERRALFDLWLANVAVAVGLGQACCAQAPDSLGPAARLLLQIALLATVAWTTALLYADTRIYDFFRYHFNGWIWAVLTTEGVTDSIQFGRDFRLLVVAAILVAFAAMYAFQRWRAPRAPGSGRPVWRNASSPARPCCCATRSRGRSFGPTGRARTC